MEHFKKNSFPSIYPGRDHSVVGGSTQSSGSRSLTGLNLRSGVTNHTSSLEDADPLRKMPFLACQLCPHVSRRFLAYADVEGR